MARHYPKILVCIDGSNNAKRAFSHACDLARNYDSTLYLMHVVDKSIGLDFFDRSDYLKLLREHGKKVLEKAQNIARHNGIKSKSILKEGNVSKEILRFAKNEQINLIIVGSKGFGVTLRFLLGSVSNKIANQASCPVLIIK